jgi:cytochrome oxidase assembly protein ShyY1
LQDSTNRILPLLGKWKGHSQTKRSGVYGATIAEADTIALLEMDGKGQLIQVKRHTKFLSFHLSYFFTWFFFSFLFKYLWFMKTRKICLSCPGRERKFACNVVLAIHPLLQSLT